MPPELLSGLALMGSAGILVAGLLGLARQYFAHQLRVMELQQARPQAPDPIPADLLGMAMRESEGWAREQALSAIRETYEQAGRDWQRVRAEFSGLPLA